LEFKSGGDLLSHTATACAIGAGGLNDRVRDQSPVPNLT